MIAGVASTRRDPSRASKGGWFRDANTIILVGFGKQPGQYNQSVLGAQFSTNRVDEDTRTFRLDAGQKEPVALVIQGSHTPHNLYRGNRNRSKLSTLTGVFFKSYYGGTINNMVTWHKTAQTTASTLTLLWLKKNSLAVTNRSNPGRSEDVAAPEALPPFFFDVVVCDEGSSA